MGVIMLGDLKVVHTKQVFHFNSVCYNEVPLEGLFYNLPQFPIIL